MDDLNIVFFSRISKATSVQMQWVARFKQSNLVSALFMSNSSTQLLPQSYHTMFVCALFFLNKLFTGKYCESLWGLVHEVEVLPGLRQLKQKVAIFSPRQFSHVYTEWLWPSALTSCRFQVEAGSQWPGCQPEIHSQAIMSVFIGSSSEILSLMTDVLDWGW